MVSSPERPTKTRAFSPASCSEPPKRVAIGIAPLGIVSIGIVPMGVVSIGVVPMGVVSLGVVGMGVLNACLVGMGVAVAGLNTMGLWTLSPSPEHAHQPASKALTIYPSQQQALKKAQDFGCSGAHPMGSGWMPCNEHPH
ncbi:hypothetical protein [Synechococcus sp. W4D4]|uniref:hypothetical protein n=1 Tax=Synechococcus sp. W4D4 TaxID=3392294 RepID=UPI0039EB84C3